jgi:hypothetical protein
MQKISLSALSVGSLIPPMFAYLARDLIDLAARGFSGVEILQILAISLLVGIVSRLGAALRTVG